MARSPLDKARSRPKTFGEARFMFLREPRLSLSEIARSLGVGLPMVSRVNKGERRSQPIEREIASPHAHGRTSVPRMARWPTAQDPQEAREALTQPGRPTRLSQGRLTGSDILGSVPPALLICPWFWYWPACWLPALLAQRFDSRLPRVQLGKSLTGFGLGRQKTQKSVC